MKSIEGIWQSRLNHHITELRSYLKYMLNDHLLFVFIFLSAGGALAYQDWLENMPENFPAIFIMTAVFTILLLGSSVRTLLKEPDVVFLLPMEKKMSTYFKQAFVYSFFSQMFVIVVMIIVFAPLYFKVSDATGSTLLLCLILLLLIKAWNLTVSWRLSFYTDSLVKKTDLAVRFALNFIAIFFTLSEAYLFAGVVFVIMVLYLAYFTKAVTGKGVKWEELIDQEARKKQFFYQLANLFTDVPKLKKSAKRRRYLDWWLRFGRYGSEHVYSYLFSRAFLRSGDYLGIFVRLTVIGGVITYYTADNTYGSLAVGLLVIFLTGIQLMSLMKHYDLLELPTLYPKGEQQKLMQFLLLIQKLLVTQAVLLSLVLLMTMNVQGFVITLAVNLAFALLFVVIYMKKRLSNSKGS
ncbi:ABC transporter permease [Metabacillus herbersteinensis]|uniref:ABC transporter permease n=1 Tax=Metabacillus herbersteinensis TaxID=283816 RepID=A0ABV6GEP8_9BACI